MSCHVPLAHRFGATTEATSAPRHAACAASRSFESLQTVQSHSARDGWPCSPAARALALKRISAVSSDMCLWHTNLGLRPKLSLHPVVLPAWQVAHSRAHKRYNLTVPAMAGPVHLQRERRLLNGFRLCDLTCASGRPIWGFDRSYLRTPSCCLRGK